MTVAISSTQPQPKLKISLLVPCYNEEKSIEASIHSCLNQTRAFDQLVYVDDSSKDKTPQILARYADRIEHVTTPKNTGNKSSAQEYGLAFVTGDIMVTTDGDTLLDPHFAEEIEKSFNANSDIVAVAGYVRSLSYNWLTLCRAFEYAIGQNIHKVAQHYMDYIYVMPGAASAFRTNIFKNNITFDHDTITEDLDFTYKLHRKKFKIVYNQRAISWTQDPATLPGYINQMRRWFGGGWQNLLKHYSIIPTTPMRAFELSLMYAEGLIFSTLLLLIPILNWWLACTVLLSYFCVAFLFAAWAAWKERRPGLLIVPIPYMLLIYINAYIYLEQFVKEIILRRKNLIWFKPDRIHIPLQ
jgi:cellulose synthase/poly-beta-1,6-N-acetylglucosamine synthase-like glycosyltransferase